MQTATYMTTPEIPAPLQRKIIHIDMDAFYAAVEQRDFPQYKGKPIVVGGSPDGRNPEEEGQMALCASWCLKGG